MSFSKRNPPGFTELDGNLENGCVPLTCTDTDGSGTPFQCQEHMQAQTETSGKLSMAECCECVTNCAPRFGNIEQGCSELTCWAHDAAGNRSRPRSECGGALLIHNHPNTP